MLRAIGFARSAHILGRQLSTVAAFENVKLPQKTDYVELPTAKGLMPEGLAGDMEEEFSMTRKRSWMIRDVSRVLCAFLDDFPVKNSKTPSDKVIPPLPDIAVKSGSSDLWHDKSYPGYSDRPEWRGSLTSAKLYGAEILSVAKPELGKLKDDVMADPALKTLSRSQTSNRSASETFRQNLKAAITKKSTGPHALPKAYPDKVLLSGERGVGKSAVLNQLIMHARSSGWICLFVPNGWDHVQSGWYIEPVPKQAGDKHNHNVYDNVFMSANLLRNFYDAHAQQLQEIKLVHPHALNKYSAMLAEFKNEWNRAKQIKGREQLGFRATRQIIVNEDHFPEQDALDAHILDTFDYPSYEPKNLKDLVLLGIAFRDVAGQVVQDVVNELKVVESAPVLIAVDQYNAWDAPSAYHWEKEQVQGFQISVPSALKFLSKKKVETDAWQLRNGFCIAAMSSKHPEGQHEPYSKVTNSIPLTLTVPAYNQREFISAVSHYEQSSLIVGGVTFSELNAFRTITGSVGREVRRETIPTFFPLSVAKAGDDFMAAAQSDRTPAAPAKNKPNKGVATKEEPYDDSDKGIMDRL